MKILFLTRLYYPHIGGVEKHVRKLSEELSKMGHKITIITEKDKKNEKSFETENISKIYRIPVTDNERFKKFPIWIWLFRHQRLIREADIIHAHDVAFWYFPFRILYPNKQFFVTFHGYERKKEPTKKTILIRKISEKIAHGNICIGGFIKKWYKTQPTLISYGAAEEIKNQKIKNRNYKYDCCFIGRLEKDTGIIKYLKAIKILKEKGVNLTLIACGDGPEKKKAKKFAQKNNLKVIFLGFVKNPNKYLLDSRFAFVSSYLAIIEAAQAKKLIFATYNTRIKKDYLTEIPIAKSIIINRTPKELASSLLYFLDHNEETKRLTNQSYSWAHKQTWKKMTKNYLKLWNINP